MADYIERGKAAELLCKMICGNDRALCVSTYKNCRQKQMLELYEIPAANVREDVQGKWLEPDTPIVCAAKCSVCGNTEYLDCGGQEEGWNFCPNCGARMTGGGEQ